MCLIIYKNIGIDTIHPNILEEAYIANNDGFGLMYPDGEGSIIIVKTLDGINNIKQLVADNSFKDKNVAYHFRYATHGAKDINNVHPFRILEKETDGLDMYLMHNGVLNINSWNNSMSDTWHFVQGWLCPIIKQNPKVIRKPWFKKYVENYIGHSNKFLIMDGLGNVEIFNEGDGKWTFEDLWLSNELYTYSHNEKDRDKRFTRVGRRVSKIYGHDWDAYDNDLNNYGMNDYGYSCSNDTSSQITHRTDHEIATINQNDNKSSDEVIIVKANTVKPTSVARTIGYDYKEWIRIHDSDLFEMELDDLLECMEANPGVVADWIFTTLYGKNKS